MIKTISISVLMLACCLLTNAQSSQGSINFGVNGGVHLSNLKGNDGKSRIGAMGGLFVEYNALTGVSLRSGLNYASLGTKKKGSINSMKLNYIQAPVLLKISPVKSFSLEAGAYAGYLLGKKGSIKKSDLKKFDLGAAMGISYNLTDQFEIGARYYLGVKNITKTTGKAKNRYLQILLSYKF